MIILCREKFGLHSVDFEDPERPRTAKASAAFISKIAADNGFVQGNRAVGSNP